MLFPPYELRSLYATLDTCLHNSGINECCCGIYSPGSVSYLSWYCSVFCAAQESHNRFGLWHLFEKKMLAVSGPIAYGIAAENMPQKDVKVCFLGSYCVGKTSITKRFVKGRFDEEYISTIGAAFLSRSLFFQNIEYRFALWDTAGQERFRSLAPLTYRSAAAALIVYDITNQDSFDEVNFWISELRREGPEGILIYVVGNKTDLEHIRVVDREKAESYAQTKGVFHFHTSAKTGQGVEEIFHDICLNEFTKTCTLKGNGRVRQNTIDLSNSNSDEDKDGRRARCRCQNT